MLVGPCEARFTWRSSEGEGMTARTETPTSESVHPLVELARTSRVPIAELIGFQMETVGGGHAVASLQSGPQHAQPDGNPPRWCAVRLARRRHGHGVCDDIGAEESFTTMELSVRFLSTCV